MEEKERAQLQAKSTCLGGLGCGWCVECGTAIGGASLAVSVWAGAGVGHGGGNQCSSGGRAPRSAALSPCGVRGAGSAALGFFERPIAQPQYIYRTVRVQWRDRGCMLTSRCPVNALFISVRCLYLYADYFCMISVLCTICLSDMYPCLISMKDYSCVPTIPLLSDMLA